MLAELPLIDCHEVIGQTLCLHGVTLWNDLLNSLRRVRIDEAEVLVRLCIRSLEVEVGGDIPGQPTRDKVMG